MHAPQHILKQQTLQEWQPHLQTLQHMRQMQTGEQQRRHAAKIVLRLHWRVGKEGSEAIAACAWVTTCDNSRRLPSLC
jgi:hypothetical protein